MTQRSLIWLLLSAALALPAPLLAEDWAPTGDRILSDPTYLPLRGQLFGVSVFYYDSGHANRFDAAHVQTSSSRTSDDVLAQGFVFGVTDELSVNMNDSYGWTRTVTDASGVGEFRRGSHGVEDPSFGVTYRVLDQRRGPLSFDVGATYTPDIVAARSATATHDGVLGRGGDVLYVRAAISHEMRFMTLEGHFGARRFGQATSKDDRGDGSTTQAYWLPTVGVATQTRFSERLSLNVGADHDFSVTSNELAIPAGTRSISHQGGVFTPYMELNYHFIPNRLVGSVGFSHGFYGHRQVDFPADPTRAAEIEQSGDTLEVRIRYVFR